MLVEAVTDGGVMTTGVLMGVLAVCVVLALLVTLRLFLLRSTGTQMLLRELPAKDTHSWRHGIVRYSPDHLKYFQLRSVRPGADLRLNRLDIVVESHRKLTDVEASFMLGEEEVVCIESNGKRYELAFDARGAMALIAWVESAPSRRRENVDFKTLQDRVARSQRNQRKS